MRAGAALRTSVSCARVVVSPQGHARSTTGWAAQGKPVFGTLFGVPAISATATGGHIADIFLKLADPVAQSFSEIGEPAGPEDQQGDHENYK